MVKDPKNIVMPGDRLGVIEEYMPGDGTYEDDGKIVSSVAGFLEIDNNTRKMGIKPDKKLAIPEVGDTVEGIVTGMKEDTALVKIIAIRGKRPLSGDFSAQLHVSQVAKGYVKSAFDAVNINDRIVAKVSTNWIPYQLSTAEDDLGVVYSTCSKCGDELVPKKGKLFCKRDNLVEKKKMSRQYLLKEEQ